MGDLQYGPGYLLAVEGEVVQGAEAGQDELTVKDQQKLDHSLVDIRRGPGESRLVVQAPCKLTNGFHAYHNQVRKEVEKRVNRVVKVN